MPISRCIELLMGDPGTTVQIRVRHTGGDEAALTVTRRQIVARTVRGIRRAGAGGEWDYCLDAALGLSYIRISQFNESTFDELLEAMQRAQEPGLNGLVLDLRDDPGGGLNAAVQVADLFLEHGDIVAVRDRHGRGRTWSASPEGTVPDFPMIVLVNQYSASASEIVAGALQENGRAKVLGTRTYGKGSVQDVRPLDFNMGTFKFTTAQYFLPGGRTINREPDSAVWGVDPDPGFVVSISDDDYRAMLRARREYEILGAAGHDDGPCNDPSWLTERVRDVQLAAALAALRARVSGEGWPVVGEDSATIIAFDQEISAARERRQWLMDQLGQTEVRLAELEQRAAEAGRAPLLPPDVDLVAGTITIHDKHGNLIGGFRIEGGNLERALEEVTLSPLNRNDGPE
jgi:carboxyl-terminal processing protease